MIIDSHAHLNDNALLGRAKQIVSNFKNDNIECCIIAGYNYESSKCAVELANTYNQYAIIGTHPQDCLEINDNILQLYKDLSKDDKVVGFGEIGLDYHYEDNPKREIQMQTFEKQLILADELNLPIALHIRDAYKDALDILNNNKKYLNNGVLLHCYSSSLEMAREFAKFDAYFAFGGVITFKNAKKEEIIKSIDIDRLLLETDCPYMAPTPYRGEINEPKHINLVAEKMAQILNLSKEELEKTTTQNTKRLFKKIL